MMLKGGVMHLLVHCQPTWLGIVCMRTCEVDEMYFRILGRNGNVLVFLIYGIIRRLSY